MKVLATGWDAPCTASRARDRSRGAATPAADTLPQDRITAPRRGCETGNGIPAILAAYQLALPTAGTTEMPNLPPEVLQAAGDSYEAALSQVVAQLEPREATLFVSLVGILSHDPVQRRNIISRLASASLGSAFSLATGYLARNLDRPAGLVAILGLVEHGTPAVFRRALSLLLSTPPAAA